MLWIDNRIGSKELLPYLKRQGLAAELVKLDAADFAFQGNGPDGEVQIGVERKTLGDLVSSLLDGRLQGRDGEDGGGQLGKLQRAYDIIYLLVEGRYKVNDAGLLCWAGKYAKRVPGGMSEDTLNKRLLSLQHQGALYVQRTESKGQTAVWLASCYHWWSKPWDQHQTLNVMHKARTMTPLSRFREMTLPLPAVGIVGTKALETLCAGSLRKLLALTLQDLTEMAVQTPKGPRRLGASKAADLMAALDKLR